MTGPVTLEQWLEAKETVAPFHQEVSETILALAEAGREIARILARGALAGGLATVVGASLDGDGQKALDAMTHDIVRDALARGPVAVYASEEAEEPELLNAAAPLAVAVDPLDGSSNIDTLVPVGTIFSILPAGADAAANLTAPFLQPGRNQLAAGFLIYGPQTALVVTRGAGTRIFAMDPQTGAFIAPRGDVAVPLAAKEYAINGSNFFHWEPEIRDYILDLLKGKEGGRGKDFNTRWLASMVGDAYRILLRGGIYLYPSDSRPGYRLGRLRLIYEANPMAMVMEQAGGAAICGARRILDLEPESIHQRTPLFFGSVEEVDKVAEVYATDARHDAPLFKTRSLYRKSTKGVEFHS